MVHTYTKHKESQIKTIVIVCIVIILIESVALHVLVKMWSDVLAWILFALNAGSIVYMIALYLSYQKLPIQLNESTLTVRCGFQNKIDIPLNRIASIEAAKEVELGEKVPKDRLLAYLRVDTPQFEIKLRAIKDETLLR